MDEGFIIDYKIVHGQTGIHSVIVRFMLVGRKFTNIHPRLTDIFKLW